MGRRDHDPTFVGLKTTYVTNRYHHIVMSNPAHGQVYSMHHYVIKFASDLRQVGGILQMFRFPPPIEL